MDYMFPSRNNENLLLTSDNKLANHHGNINLRQEEDQQPLFLHFPSPFLDNMDTTTILPNLDHHRISTDGCRTTAKLTTNDPLKPNKCVRKKRSAGKKDRHSKIHTAQGLRDRRMRLSVHTARKFFDLNDMLGFDKASKTIEWLFAQSQKAIEEVTETLQSDDATQTVSKEINECESPLSVCETESVMEITASTDIDDNLELHQTPQFDIGDETSRKADKSYPSVKESRGEARSRARERTRDTMMIKHVEKPKQLFQLADPSVHFNQSQLGFPKNLDNPNMEESSCYPLEYSNTYHFLKHLHLDNNTAKNTDTYLGNITSISSTSCSVFDYNKTLAEPPAGWLNSRNTFLGFLGGWETTNSRIESNNGITPNIAPSMNGENPTSGIISSGFSNFHSQGQ